MHKIVVLYLVIAVCLISCDKNRVYDQYKSFPNQWSRDSVVSFEVSDLKRDQPYDLFINLRNTDAYGFRNIYLITRIDFPKGKVIQDTLEYNMAYSDGAWMGVGVGETKASKLWYKKGVHFNEKGTYTFKIQQAMRKNGAKKGIQNLKGITEVGLRIENPNQTNSQKSE